MKSLKVKSLYFLFIFFPIKMLFASNDSFIFRGLNTTVISGARNKSSGLSAITDALKSQTGLVWYLAAAFIVSVVVNLFFTPNENMLKLSARIMLVLSIVALILVTLKNIG